MKCVCGYEHEEEWDKKLTAYVTIKGERKFIDVEGHFTTTISTDYYGDKTRRLSLFACPECGTIKVNPDWL